MGIHTKKKGGAAYFIGVSLSRVYQKGTRIPHLSWSARYIEKTKEKKRQRNKGFAIRKYGCLEAYVNAVRHRCEKTGHPIPETLVFPVLDDPIKEYLKTNNISFSSTYPDLNIPESSLVIRLDERGFRLEDPSILLPNKMFVVDPFSSLLYSTKAEEYQMIQSLRKQGKTVEEAIESILETRNLDVFVTSEKGGSTQLAEYPSPD